MILDVLRMIQNPTGAVLLVMTVVLGLQIAHTIEHYDDPKVVSICLLTIVLVVALFWAMFGLAPLLQMPS
jgi:predicted permease